MTEAKAIHDKIMQSYAAVSAGVGEAAAHQAVLDALDKADIETMAAVHAANNYAYLFGHMFDRAAMDDTLGHVDEAGYFKINDEKFPDEMRLLRRLSGRLDYSEAMTSWFARTRHDFTRQLAQDDAFTTGCRAWPSMNLSERGAFIQTFITKRAASANDGNFKFLPPAVLYEKMCDEGWASLTENEIGLSVKLLDKDDPRDALSAAFHEGTHNLLGQMSRAMAAGEISEDHPLADDIWTATANRWIPGGRSSVPELYNLDPEEQLAWHEEKAFLFELDHGTGLRATFKAACGIARDVLHGNLPSLPQAMRALRLD